MALLPSRARLASDDCEALIVALNKELHTIKGQLTNLTKSLNVPVEAPQAPPPYTPSPSVDPIIYVPPCPNDSVRWSICTSIDQPPTPLPRIASRRKKKKEKISATLPPPDSTMRLLRVVDEREEERAKARSRYVELMKAHIEQQLKQFVEREKRLRKRKEAKEKRAKSVKKPAKFRSTGVDDKSFLENTYQSCLYKIIGVEQGMKKCGKLKTMAELREFWEQMLTRLQSPSKCKVPPSINIWEDKHLEQEQQEEEEETNSWAVTSSKQASNLNSIRTTPAPTPLKFVPCKLPELRSIKEILDNADIITPLLDSKPTDHYPGSITRQRALVQKVYQRAKANEIAMRSLLPHGLTIERPSFRVCHEDSTSPVFSRQLPRVLPPLVHVPLEKMPDSETTQKHSIKNQNLELKCRESTNSNAGKVKVLLHPLSAKMKAPEDSIQSPHGLSPPRPVCVPLTMSKLLKVSVTKETGAKKAPVWTNYQVTS